MDFKIGVERLTEGRLRAAGSMSGMVAMDRTADDVGREDGLA